MLYQTALRTIAKIPSHAGVALPLLQQLRQASLPEHRAIEQQPWLRALLQPTLNKATYARVLHCFRLFYLQADARICDAGLQPLRGYRYIPRAPHLYADCKALAEHFWPEYEPDPGLPQRPDVETLIGWLYVIEGSSQGGQIIRPRVERTLALHDTAGLQFYSYFTAAGNGWRNFQSGLQALEAEADHPLQPHHILQSSRAFFAHLDNFFSVCSEAWGEERQYG